MTSKANTWISTKAQFNYKLSAWNPTILEEEKNNKPVIPISKRHTDDAQKFVSCL